jgi:excisionase family DNA binding protein
MQDHLCTECQRPHRLGIQAQLHDVASACQLLSISRSTFYELVKDGRIIVSKLGTKTLVSSYSIEKFVRQMYSEGLGGNQC